jgi:two-component system chemotaxis response regulator CheY
MADTNTGATARPLNILIVDDSATMRAVIRRVIALTEVPVGSLYEANNGREALKIMESRQVEAVFTDINMPVMTGHEFLKAMSENDRWDDVLRIVVSTDGSKLRRDEARNLKVALYVEKPFRPEVVRDVLCQITGAAC